MEHELDESLRLCHDGVLLKAAWSTLEEQAGHLAQAYLKGGLPRSGRQGSVIGIRGRGSSTVG